MRYAPRAILAGGLGFAVSFLVACGGGAGLLSGNQSIALSGQVNEISAAVQSGNCGAATNASAALNNDVQNLSPTINSTLRSNLSQGAGTIAQLAQKDCRLHTTSTPSTTTTSSTSSSTTSTSSTSTSTSTSTPTSTSSSSTTSTSATTPTIPGTTSTTTGGVGLGGGTTTSTGNGNSGGTVPGNGNSSAGGGG